MVVATHHAEHVQYVEVIVRDVHHHRGALVLADVVLVRRRRTHDAVVLAFHPQRGLPFSAHLVLAVHHHRVVRGGHQMPARLRRVPVAKLHRRISEFGKQIQALGHQSQVHGVAVYMPSDAETRNRIVVQPHGAGFGLVARTKNRQVPLLLVDISDARRNLMVRGGAAHIAHQPLRVVRKQIVRHAVKLARVRAQHQLRIEPFAGGPIKAPEK